MKRQLTFFVMMGLVTCAGSVAKADILSNGNLDNVAVGPQTLATPVGWSVISTRSVSGPFPDGCSSEMFANVSAPGGYGLFFKPFQGVPTNTITVSLYQDNAATAGLSYTLTGWAGAGAG